MKSITKMTQAELIAYVQSHLRKNKINVTLLGGAAVSIYTVNKYVSADVDPVEDTYVDRNKIKTAMEEIGFQEKNRYFTHPDTQHIIEFPSGPLPLGGRRTDKTYQGDKVCNRNFTSNIPHRLC